MNVFQVKEASAWHKIMPDETVDKKFGIIVFTVLR